MAFTTVPSAGAKLRGSVLSALITEVRPVPALKTVDETISSNATLQNDDALALSLSANCTYRFWLQAYYFSGSTPDIKFGFTFPSGTALSFGGDYLNTAGSFANAGLTGSTVLSCGGTGGTVTLRLDGVAIVSSTAGTLQLQWAQNTSDASSTIVYAGSILHAQRIS